MTFSLGKCDLIHWEQKVPHLQNINGGDLFLYPGFILYRAAREAFSVIDFHDVHFFVLGKYVLLVLPSQTVRNQYKHDKTNDDLKEIAE